MMQNWKNLGKNLLNTSPSKVKVYNTGVYLSNIIDIRLNYLVIGKSGKPQSSLEFDFMPNSEVDVMRYKPFFTDNEESWIRNMSVGAFSKQIDFNALESMDIKINDKYALTSSQKNALLIELFAYIANHFKIDVDWSIDLKLPIQAFFESLKLQLMKNYKNTSANIYVKKVQGKPKLNSDGDFYWNQQVWLDKPTGWVELEDDEAIPF